MTYDDFNKICGELAGTSYVMQWGNSHVWKVAGKVFAIGGWSDVYGDSVAAVTFKTSELNYYFLSEKEDYRPAPYFATRGMKWIQHYNITNFDDEEFMYYLNESYRLVTLGLTKKKQKELGFNQD